MNNSFAEQQILLRWESINTSQQRLHKSCNNTTLGIHSWTFKHYGHPYGLAEVIMQSRKQHSSLGCYMQQY